MNYRAMFQYESNMYIVLSTPWQNTLATVYNSAGLQSNPFKSQRGVYLDLYAMTRLRQLPHRTPPGSAKACSYLLFIKFRRE